jgi:predicted ATPase/class 3 adenylate cyclase
VAADVPERRLVAVMFTDMAGYTALMQADERNAVAQRDAYMAAVERHHAEHGGTIVQRLGDGTLSMFPSALAAAQAAVAIQNEVGDVPVRIGIHVGEVVVEPERLTGDAVNLAARVESFAVSGSIFLSDSAHDQLRNRTDLELRSLGSFRLKNVGRALELYAVAGPGLVVPERSTLEGKGEALVTVRAQLPQPASELLGRERELGELVGLVRAHRAVTITGPGGVGKTRLVTALGHALVPEFADGVGFVGLADVTDASGFLAALAAALDVKESEERSFVDSIVARLADRELLLVLDNFEQIVDAAPDVSELLARCPALSVAVTSRGPLRVAGEALYPLEPLPADDAVALFTERAEAVNPSFSGAEHAEAIEEICERLDGLPLALELAAARLRLLGADGLRARLDRALEVLTAGARDSHVRQQTLRATIGWSYSLLEEPEQRVFRRLAVFAGGCTFEDAEMVTGAGSLDDLETLVDAALVQANGRLRMLQTIAEFARDELESSGEATAVATEHARRYAKVAVEIRDGIEGASQLASLARGIEEEENLGAALDTLLAAARGGDADALETGLRMAGDLWMYWHIRGKNLTARDSAAAFLALAPDDVPTAGRAGALITAGLGSWIAGELERSNAEFKEAREVAAAAGAERELCLAVFAASLGQMTLDPAVGVALASESFDLARKLGFPWAEGFAVTLRGMLYAIQEDARASEDFVHGLAIQRRLEDWEGAGMSLSGLASLALQRGESAEALELYAQSLAAFQECGDRGEEARVLAEMAEACLAAGDTPAARSHFFEAVRAHTDIASTRGVGLALLGLAATAAVDGDPVRAAEIAAAAEMHAQEEGIVVVYSEETPGRELIAQARASLSEDELARATEAGRRLAIREALELARAGVD